MRGNIISVFPPADQITRSAAHTHPNHYCISPDNFKSKILGAGVLSQLSRLDTVARLWFGIDRASEDKRAEEMGHANEDKILPSGFLKAIVCDDIMLLNWEPIRDGRG